MISEITSADAFKSAIASDKLTVVDFFATWCGPCKAIAPVVDKMSEEFTDAVFIKVDVDQLGDIAAEYGVRAMPTFMLFKNGEKIETVVGANPMGLKKAIKEKL
ncbi:hypothetical protein CANCADRAFT_3115 [Tortispora caseinolytica NRRL Y-17796]|uniref:Thioredoxin n=1 Tax=Tortispora caseinolytica NRRL Y-17796 TaxID=767744 RepID=A0A1E4TI34_9ASCO|nr:hypothetical protein CANCADRAFT_3115 [Tortispora caseinolytica NRRL Y-17796]